MEQSVASPQKEEPEEEEPEESQSESEADEPNGSWQIGRNVRRRRNTPAPSRASRWAVAATVVTWASMPVVTLVLAQRRARGMARPRSQRVVARRHGGKKNRSREERGEVGRLGEGCMRGGPWRPVWVGDLG